MRDYATPVSEDELHITASSLKSNGMHAVITDSGEQAKDTVLALLPKQAEVFTMTSVTLDTIGVTDAINNGDTYISVRKQLGNLDPKTQQKDLRRLGSAPDWALGSVHAITQDGQLLIASNTGSQLAAYVYGAQRVVFVVGGQKIVPDQEEATRRIYEYVLPLEDKRAQQAYGIGSFVNKLLTINREVNPERITVILVKEALGF